MTSSPIGFLDCRTVASGPLPGRAGTATREPSRQCNPLEATGGRRRKNCARTNPNYSTRQVLLQHGFRLHNCLLCLHQTNPTPAGWRALPNEPGAGGRANLTERTRADSAKRTRQTLQNEPGRLGRTNLAERTRRGLPNKANLSSIRVHPRSSLLVCDCYAKTYDR